jgi:hypothetical protein
VYTYTYLYYIFTSRTAVGICTAVRLLWQNPFEDLVDWLVNPCHHANQTPSVAAVRLEGQLGGGDRGDTRVVGERARHRSQLQRVLPRDDALEDNCVSRQCHVVS